MSDNDIQDDEFEWDGPSKSQLKRDAHRSQNLGVELLNLNPEQLAQIPLSDRMLGAIEEHSRHKKHGAIRRHEQLMGKYMRSEDIEAIEEALDKLKEQSDRNVRLGHLIEKWRDDLIAGDQGMLARFVEQYPSCERQQLSQLLRSAKKEQSQQKPPVSARKLFRLIRDTLQEVPEE